MPPLRLTKLLQTACPDASPTSRAILSTLGCRNGDGPHADEVASWVGLRDRHQVHRWLRRDGLPPLKRLAGWARVLYWLLEAEATHASLLELAHRDEIDVATAYRLVVRVTGKHWSELRRAGVEVGVSLFQSALGRVAPPALRSPARALRTQSLPLPPPGLNSAARASGYHPAGILTERVRVTGSPYDVAFDQGGAAYVTRLCAASVEYLRLTPLRVVGSIATGAVPTRIVFSPSSAQAYVINQFTDDVAIVDLSQRRLIGRVAVPGNPIAAVLSPDARVLYVATNTDRLCAIALPGGHLHASEPVMLAGHGLTMHPSGRWLYLATFTAGSVLELDAQSLATTRSFSTGGTAQECAVSRDGLVLYVANQAGWLDAIHLPSGCHVARVTLGTAAISLALSPDDAMLYAGLLFAGRIALIDRARLQIVGTLAPGGKPRRIAFDPSGRCALIANESGWVDLVR